MVIIYDLIFLIIAIFYLPGYLFKGKFTRGFISRLGILPRNLQFDRPIWIHVVSVGEAMAVRRLLEGLRKAYSAKRFVVSTVTASGNKIIRSYAKENDFITYFPLDLSFICESVVKRINPCVMVIAETELWPNFILALSRNKIPVIMVNTRISDKSFKSYSAVKLLLTPLLNKVDLFCAQTEIDAKRLAALGVYREKIKVTGNMKFDSAGVDKKTIDYASGYKKFLGLDSSDILWVGASTHPKEEEIIIGVYKELINEFKALRLLIAPRHPERAGEIKKTAEKFGVKAVFISSFNQAPSAEHRAPIFILDTVGELMNYYAVCDITFVGGSLIKKGGHNILEPAVFSKPIIIGPYMFNFRDIAGLFLKEKACVLVHNRGELVAAIRNLLNNPDKMEELGRRAVNLIEKNKGASERNIKLIKTMISL